MESNTLNINPFPINHEGTTQGMTQPNPGQDVNPKKGTAATGSLLVKIGGSTLGSHDTTLVDIIALQKRGVIPVVVHGGGKVISEWMEKQGVRPRFVNGLRVTDPQSMDIVTAVLTGLINKQLVATINAMGGKAVGLSGADGGMMEAEIMDRELGLVGNVTKVNADPILAVMERGFMPVIAPVAVKAGAVPGAPVTLLNINADTAAGQIAVALRSEKLVFMTDVEGVKDSSNRVISRLTERQAKELVDSKVIAGGMIPKIGACLLALHGGRSTHIVDGRKPNALMDVLNGAAIGTRVG
ncbi:MAG: acetylglutamate kinase [SAR202 cluster bacterium]|nr:acetylglutamate kinase [SAR202 cluster bacterium]